jgi:hypothetical protein
VCRIDALLIFSLHDELIQAKEKKNLKPNTMKKKVTATTAGPD